MALLPSERGDKYYFSSLYPVSFESVTICFSGIIVRSGSPAVAILSAIIVSSLMFQKKLENLPRKRTVSTETMVVGHFISNTD